MGGRRGHRAGRPVAFGCAVRRLWRAARQAVSLRQLVWVAAGAQVLGAATLLVRGQSHGPVATLLLTCVGIATGLCLLLILRSVADPLTRLGRVAGRVRAGELTT